MQILEQWDKNQAVFRGVPGKPLSESTSCGFLKKSNIAEDVINEQYDRFVMVYVLRGSGHYEDSMGLSFPLAQGDAFFRCPDREHSSSVEPNSHWLECFVSVRSEWYDLFKEIRLLDSNTVHFRLGLQSEIPQKIDHWTKALQASDTPLNNSNIEFEIVSLIRQILLQRGPVADFNSPHLEQVERARALIRTHANKPDSLEGVLHSLGLSYSRIRSLFRETYGISPGDYRIQVRIEKACALLTTTSHTIQEIANDLGYGDAFTFSKQFKQRMGVSPSSFRASHST